MELNSLPEISAYFPDGTWCGNEGGKDLFCLQRTCVSQDMVEGLIRSGTANSGDLDITNNAPMMTNHQMPEDIKVCILVFLVKISNV